MSEAPTVSQYMTTRARRVVVVDRHHVCGVISGMDFARALRAR